ncbi:MAG: zinc metallopeptidase [Opitutales bacterium]|nr:zinc metallopeptidase [Opitutales bacterium]
MNLTFAFIVIGAAFIMGLWAQAKVSSAYNKYKQVGARSRITGRDAAAYVMQAAGVHGVDIVPIRGQLTDHYDPVNKRLALSEANYYGYSLAAVGVAAHEAGHAVQDKENYGMLKLRMQLVPMTMFASKLLPLVIFGGFFFHMFGLIYIGAACYAALTLFSLITLPVEFNATARAKQAIVNLGILERDEMVGVNKTLDAAAWTYVAAFVSSLGWLLYYLALISGSNRD